MDTLVLNYNVLATTQPDGACEYLTGISVNVSRVK